MGDGKEVCELADAFITILRAAERTGNPNYVELIKNEVSYIRVMMAAKLENGEPAYDVYTSLLKKLSENVDLYSEKNYPTRNHIFKNGCEGLCFVCEHQEWLYTSNGCVGKCNYLPKECPNGYMEEETTKKWHTLEASMFSAALVSENNKPNILKDFYKLFKYGDKELSIEESFDVARRVDIFNSKFDNVRVEDWASGLNPFLTKVIGAWALAKQSNVMSHDMARNALKLLLMMPNSIINQVTRDLPPERLESGDFGVGVMGVLDMNGDNPEPTLDFIKELSMTDVEHLEGLAEIRSDIARSPEEVERFQEKFNQDKNNIFDYPTRDEEETEDE